MSINRNNYEEYFILYLDNELNEADRAQVEGFVAVHPDLKEELDLLLQTRFLPDMQVTFEAKEDLVHAATFRKFDLTTALLSKLDHELTAVEEAHVEALIQQDASVKEEWEQIRLLKLEAEPIIFERKELLYRHEEKKRPVIMWWRMAAAAVLLLLAGLFWFRARQAHNVKPAEYASKGSVKKEAQKPVDNQRSPSPVNTENPVTNPAEQAPQSTADDLAQSPVPKKTITSPAIQKNDQEQPAPDLVVLPVNQKENKSNLPKEEDAVKPVLAVNQMPSQQNPNNSTVTAGNTDTYNVQDPGTEDIIYASDTGKKNKLRGLFRKVTRNFEKRTSINTTDDDDRLLVGGLAIRLK